MTCQRTNRTGKGTSPGKKKDGREREGERDRERERQTERDRQRERQTERENSDGGMPQIP